MRIVEMMAHVFHHQKKLILRQEMEIQEQENEVLREAVNRHNRQHGIEMHRADALMQDQQLERELKDLHSRQQEKEQKDQLLHILHRLHRGLVKDQDPVVPAAQAVPAVVHVQGEVLIAAGEVN